MEDAAPGWVSGNTVSILSSSPHVLSDPKAHKSFFMLCFHLLSCFCLTVSKREVGTVSHYRLAQYLTWLGPCLG